MVTRNFDANGNASNESGYISNSSGNESEHNVHWSNWRTGTSSRTNDIDAAAFDTNSLFQRPSRRGIYGVNTDPLHSRIPVTTTAVTPPRIDHVSVARYDQRLLQVRRELNRQSLTPMEQTLLGAIISSLERLREAAQQALPDIEDLILRYISLPVYGPLPRPLSEAAIRQNFRARNRQSHASSLTREGRYSPRTQVHAAEPIRYDNAYDNMLGVQSQDDGTPAAYA
jgi:hypothetical protein